MTVDLLWMASVFFVVACGLNFSAPLCRFDGYSRCWKSRRPFIQLPAQLGIITATVGLKVGLLTEDLYAVVLLIVIAAPYCRRFCYTIVRPSGNNR